MNRLSKVRDVTRPVLTWCFADPTPTVLDMQKGGAAAIVPADYNGDPVSYATLNYGSTAEALSEGMEVLNTPPGIFIQYYPIINVAV